MISTLILKHLVHPRHTLSHKFFGIIRDVRLGSLLAAQSLSLLTGCQLPYLVKSAYHQLAFLNQRVPIETVLKNPNLHPEDRHKLELAERARSFASNKLHLNGSKNYQSYVQLDRPYVTYVVSAAPKWELKAYVWSFPIVGKVPYKGFFNEDDAKKEQQIMDQEGYDTYLRGVSAFSTLGWFNDPLTSAMLRYHDYDLVNTIIHENVHATIYIKHEADFNERLAVFLGNKGMEMFYRDLEGDNSQTLQAVQAENADEKLFSEYMSGKLRELESWYKQIAENDHNEEIRQKKFQQIVENFESEILPKMKTAQYKSFAKIKLNNARLINFKTYYQDLSDFEKLFEMVDQNFEKFMNKIKALESHHHPSQGLKDLIKSG